MPMHLQQQSSDDENLQNFPFPWGNLRPHLIHGFLGLPNSSPQMASHLAIFVQFTVEFPYNLQQAATAPPPKKIFFPLGSAPASSTWLLAHSSQPPNDILIISAIFAGLTNEPTD